MELMQCSYHTHWMLHFWESCQREQVRQVDWREPALLAGLKLQFSSGASISVS